MSGTYDQKKIISYLVDGESAHPSFSIKLQVSPVSHWKAWKLQHFSCCSIWFKRVLGKLMFYTLQLGGLVYTISVS